MIATPPYIGQVEPGGDFFPLANMRHVCAIEIAPADDLTAWIPMAALVPDHYDVVHHAEGERARPVYFSRRPTGLRLHPAADKLYCIRVRYRVLMPQKAPDAAA